MQNNDTLKKMVIHDFLRFNQPNLNRDEICEKVALAYRVRSLGRKVRIFKK